MGLPIIVVGAGGRMGKTICNLVLDSPELDMAGMVERTEYQPTVVPVDCVVSDDLESVVSACPANSVVVDFSSPESSLHSAEVAADRGVALVIGTTGFDADQVEILRGYAKKTRIFWSPNMSVGVSVLQKILPILTKSLGSDYDVDIVEIHHNKKKDSPSGTALRLGECVAEARGWDLADVRNSARNGLVGPRPKEEIGVMAVRGGDVVGVHTVYFMGPGECIEVTHRAESRANFAQGALRAAQWLDGQGAGKLYTMSDMV
ncbi:MAG: 4-hydroxy-tetrahydrodipicolinate reductase [Desulfovibrionaceae bacterium]|nr:4-hydroxy-tetrahydrodipicolinate reductase [Desulfovibrionaceae bacterium]